MAVEEFLEHVDVAARVAEPNVCVDLTRDGDPVHLAHQLADILVLLVRLDGAPGDNDQPASKPHRDFLAADAAITLCCSGSLSAARLLGGGLAAALPPSGLAAEGTCQPPLSCDGRGMGPATGGRLEAQMATHIIYTI